MLPFKLSLVAALPLTVRLLLVVAAAFAVDPMLLNDLPVFVDERDDGPFDG